MADREKVIRGLECCLSGPMQCDSCPYKQPGEFTGGCAQKLKKDAIALIKEQEPTTYAYDEYVTPTCQKCGFHPFAGYIPTLKWMEEKGYNYCTGCGRKIKW